MTPNSWRRGLAAVHRLAFVAIVASVSSGAAQAQNDVGANDAPIDPVPGAQVPPPNVPLWGDARIEIPAHNASIPLQSRVLFVSPDGRDAGRGTLESPFGLAKALADAPTGATIVLRGGIYRVGSLQINNKALTLQAYQSEKP